ncbi:hypothetical protein ACLOAV_005889 [Pseudogymnoascus australis]
MPQLGDSSLKRDARFLALFPSGQAHNGDGVTKSGASGNAEVRALLLLLQNPSVDPAERLKTMIEVVNGSFMRILRLTAPMDPARPLAVYGIDSLAVVGVRNWARRVIGALSRRWTF